jgi:hypothetical protein
MQNGFLVQWVRIDQLRGLPDGSGYGTLLPLQPKTKKITHITRNMKNKIFAIPAEAAAIPPNPSTAAIKAIIRNVTAQPNIFSPPFKDLSRQLMTLRVF